ncbi:hypothetical protein PWT90_00484 [Aphanocladium album]|nr:hypothetical protein PWT90_00484 [Aphanocladium album]
MSHPVKSAAAAPSPAAAPVAADIATDELFRIDVAAIAPFKPPKSQYSGRCVEPVLMHQPLAKCQPKLVAETDVDFIVMTRKVFGGGEEIVETFPGAYQTQQYHGEDHPMDREVHIRIPRDKVAGLVQKGWYIKIAQAAKYSHHQGQYKDRRPRPNPPIDRFTTDKPATDVLRFLKQGSKTMATSWTNKSWAPGDMLGPDGADPLVKAKTASLIPHEKWQDWSQSNEMRSVTSIAHVHHHSRPNLVGVGWGDFDKFDRWQSYGRQVRGHMVPNRAWPTVVRGPIMFVKEDGTAADSFSDSLAGLQLPVIMGPAWPLKELLDPAAKKRKYSRHQQGPTY